jgi:hypothetical protein
MPGSYPDDLWPDDDSLSPSSPPYSPQAVGSERVIEASSSVGSSSIPNVDQFWSPATSFVYESSLVIINLGRRTWGLRQPAYGFNGLVEGAVKLRRKCTHVGRVEVSVESLVICACSVQLTNITRSDLFIAPRKSQGDCLSQRDAF